MTDNKLAKYLPGFVFEIDTEFNIVQAWPESFFEGIDIQKKKRKLTSFIHPKNRKAFSQFVEQLNSSAKNKTKSIELLLLTPEKKEALYLMQLQKKSKKGYVFSAISCSSTITKNQLSNQLHQLHSFKNFLEKLPFPFASCTKDFELTFVNKKFKEVFGYNLAEIKEYGKWFKLFQWKSPEEELEHDKEFYSTMALHEKNPNAPPKAIVRKILAKDKSIKDIAIYFSFLDNEIFGILDDITEKKKTELQLQENHEKFKRIVENIPLPFVRANLDLSINFINQKFTEFTGRTLDEVHNYEDWSKFMILKDPKEQQKRLDEYNKLLKQYKKNKNISFPILTRQFKTKNEDIKDVKFNFTIFEDQIYCVLEDITYLKSAERDLKESHFQLRELTSHLQMIREEERKHIAREVHDELGQLITALKIDISFTKKKIEKDLPEMGERLAETMLLADKLVNTVRRISTSLRPSLLDDIGLTAAIEWESKQIKNKYGINFTFRRYEPEIDLTPEQRTHLFRIFQESTTNIIRHSSATNINIELYKEKRKIFLTIEDNGKGFDLTKKSKTLGILGIKERVTSLNGEFNIHSSIGKGTKISIQLPI